jgi:hypothetical protein
MNAARQVSTEFQTVVETRLGFEIHRNANGSYVAIPQGWAPPHATTLEAPNLPALRQRIWNWWHRLLD